MWWVGVASKAALPLPHFAVNNVSLLAGAPMTLDFRPLGLLGRTQQCMAGQEMVWDDATHLLEQPYMLGHGLGYAPWACNCPTLLVARGTAQLTVTSHQLI